ncbi:MAG: nucleotidyltransferase domain-containing protein [Bacteroidota bacterium]|nr:nucleotidyltransferase domain-containing protein [Bacteroidota bacterium]
MELPLSLDTIRQVLADYFADKPVQRVEIFGSYARGEATVESDLDVLINLVQPTGWGWVCYADDLSRRLGIKVEISTAVSDYMMRYIRKDLQTVYELKQKQAA